MSDKSDTGDASPETNRANGFDASQLSRLRERLESAFARVGTGMGGEEGTGSVPDTVEESVPAPRENFTPHRRRDETVDERDHGSTVHPVKEAVLADVHDHFEDYDAEARGIEAPGEEYIDTRFFDFRFLDAYEVVEWKWVNRPYAFVAIVTDEENNKRLYHVAEPMLDEFEYYVWRDLLQAVRNQLLYHDVDEESEEDAEDVFEGEITDIMRDHAVAIADPGTLQKLYYYLRRDFVDLGPIDPLMRDEDIEDISCDGPDIPVFIYHFEYRDLRTNVDFDRNEDLKRYVLRLANRSGEQISVSNPLVDGSLPDGSRVQLTLGGDITTRGANFTIRKFANVPYTPVHLVKWGTFSVEQMAYFWLAIENNRSLIFAGGTGSGKTTSMNAVSFFIPGDRKIVSIEDTRELSMPHDNWVQQLTRNPINAEGRGEVGMYDLLQSALRQRPEYLLVGEIRTDDRVAFTFFQAIGTGHTAYTTLHADSLEGVINRLENQPLNIPPQMILDLDIVSIQKQTHLNGERVRRNHQVSELIPGDGPGSINAINTYEHDPDADAIRDSDDSQVMEDIAEDRGWSRKRLARERRKREDVLRYLVENDIESYHAVTSVIHTFHENEEYVMQKVRDEELSLPDVVGENP
jgi:flagellar protein FlaI